MSNISDLTDALWQGRVIVHVDTNTHGVVVPEYLCSKSIIALSLTFGDLAKLKATTVGLQATLVFRGSSFDVNIPWTSIVSWRNPHGKTIPFRHNKPTTTTHRLQLVSDIIEDKCFSEPRIGHLYLVK